MKAAALLLAIALAVWMGMLAFRSLPKPQVVSAFATPLSGRSQSQRHNSALALSRLNGTVIQPGAEFSFNRRVGGFSEGMGYRKAPVSYNGQLISDWGGGVCQTSTTLYNAALMAGMKIIERHRHRFAPGYIQPGRDAAVAYSNIDLRFKNPYKFPVIIDGSMQGNTLTVSLTAFCPLPVHPQVVSKIRQEQDYQTFRIGTRTGSSRIRNAGKEGCEVAVYRIIGDNRELVSLDTYPAMNRVVQYR